MEDTLSGKDCRNITHGFAISPECGRTGGPLLEKRPEPSQRKCKQSRTDHHQHYDLRPDDIETGPPKQDGLSKDDEVRVRGGEHDPLHQFRHTFERRRAAGQNLERQQDQHEQQPELRHGTRRGCKEDAERCRGEELENGGKEEQDQRALKRYGEQALRNDHQRERRGDQHDKAHGPDLADHDFQRRDRHDQQMLDRPVLALADKRGARKHDREHGDVVDDARYGAEPAGIELRIESGANAQVNRERDERPTFPFVIEAAR